MILDFFNLQSKIRNLKFILVGRAGFEPAKFTQQIYSLPSLAAWVSPQIIYDFRLMILDLSKTNHNSHKLILFIFLPKAEIWNLNSEIYNF